MSEFCLKIHSIIHHCMNAFFILADMGEYSPDYLFIAGNLSESVNGSVQFCDNGYPHFEISMVSSAPMIEYVYSKCYTKKYKVRLKKRKLCRECFILVRTFDKIKNILQNCCANI